MQLEVSAEVALYQHLSVFSSATGILLKLGSSNNRISHVPIIDVDTLQISLNQPNTS